MNHKNRLFVFFLLCWFGSSSAQTYRDDVVVLYQECGYRGKAKLLPPGEFKSIRRIGFNNDSLSSIRIPPGLEVTIYEDDDYRGAFARVDRSVSCFASDWNNKVSSLKVVRKSGGFSNDSGSFKRGPNHQSVTAKEVSYVEFNGWALQQISKNKWELSTASRQRPDQQGRTLDEIERNQYAVYLQNRFSGQRIRVDFFTNDVTVIDRKGRQEHYKIDQTYSALPASRPGVRPIFKPAFVSKNNNVIRGQCFTIKAFTDGGTGGLRFSGHEGFHRYTSRPYTNRLCHKGEIKMEISKLDLHTSVFVELNGQRYSFIKGQKHDVLKNNWYRKNLTLVVRP